MKECTLTYGKSTLSIKMPKEAMLGPIIKPSVPPRKMTAKEILDSIKEAIASPIEGEKLSVMAASKRVVVLVNDEFRAGYQQALLQAIMEELAMTKPSNVTVICATGTHDPKVYTKNVEILAHDAAAKVGLKISFVGHDCDDPNLVDIGITPLGTPLAVESEALRADVLVFLHECKVHYMNGYSLPDKMALPGISARKSVEANHQRALDADNSVGGNSPHHDEPSISNNPFGRDTRDARRMLEQTRLNDDGTITQETKSIFTVDMLSDSGYVHNTFAGPAEAVIAKMIPRVDELTTFNVERADFVVISPGGPPACNALYGVQNCFDLSLKGAIKEGGEALLIAPCSGRPDLPEDVSGLAPDANSKALFWDNMVRLLDQDIDVSSKWIDENFQLYLWKTDRVLKLVNKNKIKLYLYSDLDPKKLEGSPFIPVTDPQAWIDERAVDGKTFNVIDSGNKVLVRGK